MNEEQAERMTNWLCRIFGHKKEYRYNTTYDIIGEWEKFSGIFCKRCGVKLR